MSYNIMRREITTQMHTSRRLLWLLESSSGAILTVLYLSGSVWHFTCCRRHTQENSLHCFCSSRAREWLTSGTMRRCFRTSSGDRLTQWIYKMTYTLSVIMSRKTTNRKLVPLWPNQRWWPSVISLQISSSTVQARSPLEDMMAGWIEGPSSCCFEQGKATSGIDSM